MIKIASFSSTWKKPIGKLMKILTGCYAYHSAFIDMNTGILYEMNIRRRARKYSFVAISKKINEKSLKVYDLPAEINQDDFLSYLIQQTMFDDTLYGFRDYFNHFIYSISKFLGIPKKFKNTDGFICSDMVNHDMIVHGWNSPWPEHHMPPTPCDIERHFDAKR